MRQVVLILECAITFLASPSVFTAHLLFPTTEYNLSSQVTQSKVSLGFGFLMKLIYYS